MSGFHRDILRFVRQHDGKYSWYQLDRWLSGRWDPALASGGLMPALHELQNGGLPTSTAGDRPGQPRYALTDAGRQVLAAPAATQAAL